MSKLSKRAQTLIREMGYTPSDRALIAYSMNQSLAAWLRYPNAGWLTVAEVACYVGLPRPSTHVPKNKWDALCEKLSA